MREIMLWSESHTWLTNCRDTPATAPLLWHDRMVIADRKVTKITALNPKGRELWN